jgi:uncharacterized membrane protein YvlD (DUF360 family)
MIRLLVQIALSLLANTVGLLAATFLLDGFSIDALSIVSVVIIFSLATVFIGPLLLKLSIKNAPVLTGGISLFTTFAGLLVADVISDGLTIDGFNTWVLATLIVWLFGVIATLILPLIFFKKTLEKHKAN